MKAPRFWDLPQQTFKTSLLKPLSLVYRGVTLLHRHLQKPYDPKIPVFCIGNLTLGGSGKTPAALALASLLKEKKKRVHFISRGYGGNLKGPVPVSANHTAREVGDEPLLLSQRAPTWIAKDRPQALQAAETAGAEILILDDGHQNFSIKKTKSILVIDGKRGFGNECLFPAGPLREPVEEGLKRADLILVIGPPSPSVLQTLSGRVFHKASVEADPQALASLKGKRFVAFAGIAYPEKFFDMLRREGIDVLETISFPDHYAYNLKDFDRLLKRASLTGSKLLTTEKDHVRLSPQMRKLTHTLPVNLVFENPEAILKDLEIQD